MRRRELAIVVAVSVGLFVVAVEFAAMTVVCKTIATEMECTFSQLQWIVNGYSMVCACLLLVAGRLSDRYGDKRLYLWGLGLFFVATLAQAVSPSFAWLTAARMVLGGSAAIILTVSLTLLSQIYQGARRAVGISIVSSVMAAGMVFGVVSGGAVAALSWRMIPWTVAIVMGANFGFARVVLPRTTGNRSQYIDWLGLILFTTFFATFITSTIEGRVLGWSSMPVLVLMGVSLVVFIALIVVERSKADPALPLHHFKSRSFCVPMFANFALVACSWAVFFLVTLYLVEFRGNSPSQASWVLLLLPLPVAIASLLGGLLAAKAGDQKMVALGLLSSIVAVTLLATMSEEATIFRVSCSLLLVGISLAAGWGASAARAIAAVPDQIIGTGAGGFATVQEVARASGIAISATLFATVADRGFLHGFHVAMWVVCGMVTLALITTVANAKRESL